jgi:hypothetical protein
MPELAAYRAIQGLGAGGLFSLAVTIIGADAVPADSSVLSRLHPELARPFLTGFADATSLVFAVGAVVLVVGLVAALLLPDEQLLAGDD